MSKPLNERWKLDGSLKCSVCGYYPGNIWLFDNLTAYPHCGDQSCFSGFMFEHPGFLKRLEDEGSL